jgi:hypothetical protein
MATHASPHTRTLHGHDVTVAPVTATSRRTSVRALRARMGRWLGVGVLMIAGAFFFCGFDSLPFQDLPAHAGLIALRHHFAEWPIEQRYFVLAAHLGPYSLFRFLGELFLMPFGPVGAVRVMATL